MSFNLDTDIAKSYEWPITVNIPNNGKYIDRTFKGEFALLDNDELKQIREGSFVEDDSELAKVVLIGWSGVKGEDGEEIPYSDETKEKLLNIPYVCHGIVVSFLESLSGAKLKNSNRRRK